MIIKVENYREWGKKTKISVVTEEKFEKESFY